MRSKTTLKPCLSILSLIVGLVSLSAFAACSSTTISPDPLEPEYLRLLSINRRTIALEVRSALEPKESVGHQFLFGIIPLQSVHLPEQTEFLRLALVRELAKRGYFLAELGSKTNAKIDVIITDVSLSGYDLLFVRKPSASLAAEASLFREGNLVRKAVIDDANSEYTKYAFAPQLSQALTKLADNIAIQICDQLGIQ